MSGALAGSHPLLNTRPDFVKGEPDSAKPQDLARFYESQLKLHHECSEMVYVKARLATAYNDLGAMGTAIELGQEIQAQLADMDIQDNELDSVVDKWDDQLHVEAVDAAASDLATTTFQSWKATAEHRFPPYLPMPPGHEDLRKRWQSHFRPASAQYRGFLLASAIETNHIEKTFRITESSAEDLIRHGVVEGRVEVHPASEIADESVIKDILHDTLAAYDVVDLIARHHQDLTPYKISDIHSRVMATARFHGQYYIPPGDTRTITRQTVYVNEPKGRVRFCPYLKVDSELVAICRSTKALLKNTTNSFAVASWLHLVLARCHPFDDGNGRVARLAASLPLLLAGYPPMYIAFDKRAVYFDAISQTYDGNYTPFMHHILDGAKTAMDRVERLLDSASVSTG
ncbi:fido domain-containing protein [Favolaschia claudopus]|uniref:Fido domain-containing protein n=1 Tax=Favolaschia claudopus TaxID=2862362 RepID=A0AAW0AZU6_9AGAR